MDKAALISALTMSERNKSIVEIKMARREKPLVCAVQKVLSHMVLVRTASAQPVTLTFADIEAVRGASQVSGRVVQTLMFRLRRLVGA